MLPLAVFLTLSRFVYTNRWPPRYGAQGGQVAALIGTKLVSFPLASHCGSRLCSRPQIPFLGGGGRAWQSPAEEHCTEAAEPRAIQVFMASRSSPKDNAHACEKFHLENGATL